MLLGFTHFLVDKFKNDQNFRTNFRLKNALAVRILRVNGLNTNRSAIKKFCSSENGICQVLAFTATDELPSLCARLVKAC